MAGSLVTVENLGRGVYICWLYMPVEKKIHVGALGECVFPIGYYAYIGSAQSGLYHRLRRHCKLSKPLRWHIDYLRSQAEMHTIMVVEAGKAAECILAKAVADLPGAKVIVPGFGASDCGCPTHLYYFAELPEEVTQPERLISGLHIIPCRELIC